jgi:hypothetical protein
MAGDEKQKKRDEALEGVADTLHQLGNLSPVDARHKASAALLREAIIAQCDGHDDQPFTDDQITILVRVLGEVVKMHQNGKPKGFLGRQIQRFSEAEIGTQWAIGAGVVAVLGAIVIPFFIWIHVQFSNHVETHMEILMQSFAEEYFLNESGQE